MGLRDRLMAHFRTLKLELGELQDDTPLFDSGLLDSQGLFFLAVWIEEQAGRPLEPGDFDPRREWGTVADIVRFVERRRG